MKSKFILFLFLLPWFITDTSPEKGKIDEKHIQIETNIILPKAVSKFGPEDAIRSNYGMIKKISSSFKCQKKCWQQQEQHEEEKYLEESGAEILLQRCIKFIRASRA